MKVLFLVHPGKNSRRIFQDMILGFERAGHAWLALDLSAIWSEHTANPTRRDVLASGLTMTLRQAVQSQGIDATCAMWHNVVSTLGFVTIEGRSLNPIEAMGVPHMMYWLDAPHWAHGGELREVFGTGYFRERSIVHAINNEATASEMRQVLGFGQTVSVPYGVNPEIFRPHDVPIEHDLVINAGPGDPSPTPEMLAAIESEDPPMEALARDVAERTARPQIRTILKDAGDAAVSAGLALLETQLTDRYTPMLARAHRLAEQDASLGEGVRAILASPRLWVDVSGACRSVSAWERAFIACWLSRRVRTAVVGEFSQSWPVRGERIGGSGGVAYEELSRCYSAGRVGLNVMRWQDDQGTNIKPLEMAASGIAPVCGRRAGLEAILSPGRECEVFDTPRGALEAVRGLLADEHRRREMAQAARARVLGEHTWAHRAPRFVEALTRASAEMRGG